MLVTMKHVHINFLHGLKMKTVKPGGKKHMSSFRETHQKMRTQRTERSGENSYGATPEES